MLGKLVRYKGAIYKVEYDYGNGYLEIRERNSRVKIELARDKDLVEIREQ